MMRTIFILLCVIGFLHACSGEKVEQSFSDGVAPGMLQDIVVTNIPGGAELSYKLPLDEDLLFVEAQFEQNGVKRNVKASCYESKLLIEGYADLNEHSVKLFCVDRSNNYSEPVTVSIQPEENPIFAISRSIQMENGIGGIKVAWKNERNTVVNLLFYASDDEGKMQLVDLLSTSATEGSFNLRGFDDQERRFAVQVKDHWDNLSDTVSDYFKPRFEQLIPKADYKRMMLPEDNKSNSPDWWPFEQLFDDVAGVDNNGWHTTVTEEKHGVYFTIDLGHKVEFTRYMLWSRGGQWPYSHMSPKRWKVYGRLENPEDTYLQHPVSDEEYWSEGFREDTENWTLLMECESEKPSGIDNPEVTPEDIEFANRGFDFIFPEGMPAVRYLRFTMDETWGGAYGLHISELAFYGKIVDEPEQ